MMGAIAEPPATRGGRTGDLDALVQTLWPAPVTWTLGRVDSTARGQLIGDLIVLPRTGEPRTLMPRRPTHASAVTRASSTSHSARQRVRGGVASVAMRSGVGPLLGSRLRLWSADPAGADTIERALSAVVGAPVTVSVRLGPPRANRKPVLYVLSAKADVLAVAKLGTTDLGRALVLAETSALRALGGHEWENVTIPRVMHAGWWHDAALLVQSPLLARRGRRITPERRMAAMREVAQSAGVHTGPAVGSDYVEGLAARIDALPDRSLAEQMSAALRRIAQGSLQFGAWHGDWTDWNTAAGDATVMIWDWERMAAPVPLGFDAVHYAVQADLVRAGGPTPAHARDLLASGERLLDPFGVAPTAARTVVALYLLELAARYAADDQTTAGVLAGRVREWILPVIERTDPGRTPRPR